MPRLASPGACRGRKHVPGDSPPASPVRCKLEHRTEYDSRVNLSSSALAARFRSLFVAPRIEQAQINGIGHRRITCVVRMEMVTAIVRGQEFGWVFRIANHGIEIY